MRVNRFIVENDITIEIVRSLGEYLKITLEPNTKLDSDTIELLESTLRDELFLEYFLKDRYGIIPIQLCEKDPKEFFEQKVKEHQLVYVSLPTKREYGYSSQRLVFDVISKNDWEVFPFEIYEEVSFNVKNLISVLSWVRRFEKSKLEVKLDVAEKLIDDKRSSDTGGDVLSDLKPPKNWFDSDHYDSGGGVDYESQVMNSFENGTSEYYGY